MKKKEKGNFVGEKSRLGYGQKKRTTAVVQPLLTLNLIL